MKKIIIIMLLICVMSSLSLNCRSIKVSKTGTGEGYTVVEEHTDGWWFIIGAKSRLTCVAPGPAACVWTINPILLPDMTGPNGSDPRWEELKGYAEDEIAKGQLRGSLIENLEINGDLWYRNVVWEATNTNEFNIEVNVDLVP